MSPKEKYLSSTVSASKEYFTMYIYSSFCLKKLLTEEYHNCVWKCIMINCVQFGYLIAREVNAT